MINKILLHTYSLPNWGNKNEYDVAYALEELSSENPDRL